MSTRSVESFDSYSAGTVITDANNLGGGFGWADVWKKESGGDWTVETAPAGGQGGMAARSTSTVSNTKVYRPFANAASFGSFRFRMRLSIANPNDNCAVFLYETNPAGGRIYVRFGPSGDIEAYDYATDYISVKSGYSVDTWYVVKIEWDDVAHPNQFRVIVDDGTPSDWLTVNTGGYTTIAGVVFENSATNAHTFWNDDLWHTDGEEHTTESGEGIDALVVSELAEKSLADSGVGLDELSKTVADIIEKSLADSGSGVDAITIAAAINFRKTYSDNFNRADANPIGGDWVTISSMFAMQLLSYQITGSTAGDCGAYFNKPLPQNQYSRAIMPSPTDVHPTLLARVSASEKTFYLALFGASLNVGRFNAGVQTDFISTAFTFSPNDVIELRTYDGPNSTVVVQALVNGNVVFTHVDSGAGIIASGYAGAFALETTGYMDDFECGELGEMGLGVDSLSILEALAKELADAGSGADAFSLIEVASALAESGVGSDQVSAISASLSIMDGGSGSDLISLVEAALVILESGIGSDVLAALVTEFKTLEDSGVGSDAIGEIASALSIADLGSGADAIAALSVALAIAESGVGTDILSIEGAAPHTTESGTGVDEMTVYQFIDKALADSGSGADAFESISAALSIAESATGADGFAILEAALSILESGAGTDVLQTIITVFKALEDSGSGVDAISLIQALLAIGETGSGSDSAVISALVALQDSGAGSDTVAAIAELILVEVGSGADALSVEEFIDIIQKTLDDGGTGTDVLAAIQAAIALQDSGSGVDLMALAAAIPIGESGAGVDVVSLIASLGIGESGAGSDGVLFYAPLGIVDAGSGADLLSLLNQIALADEAAGVDTMVRVLSGVAEILETGSGSDLLSIEARVSLAELGHEIDAMLLEGSVVIVDAGGALDRLVIPRLACARDTYNAMARQREYDAQKRKREQKSDAKKRETDAGPRTRDYNATPRKREHDDQ